ncbi:MAG: GNAT family N-acetyltransferase [Paracoccaceae bacterium]
MTPFHATPEYSRWPHVAALIRPAFAYMEPLLGHPQRVASVTPPQLARAAETGTAMICEDKGCPVACLFTRPSRDYPDVLYLGWSAVNETARGNGLARQLISLAEAEARTGQYAAMTLDTGRPVTDPHLLFRHLGCKDILGYDETMTFRKPLP